MTRLVMVIITYNCYCYCLFLLLIIVTVLFFCYFCLLHTHIYIKYILCLIILLMMHTEFRAWRNSIPQHMGRENGMHFPGLWAVAVWSRIPSHPTYFRDPWVYESKPALEHFAIASYVFQSWWIYTSWVHSFGGAASYCFERRCRKQDPTSRTRWVPWHECGHQPGNFVVSSTVISYSIV